MSNSAFPDLMILITVLLEVDLKDLPPITPLVFLSKFHFYGLLLAKPR